MANRIQLRRDYAANWTSFNPILDQGEPGVEVDTGRMKVGDGVSQWSSLGYMSPGNQGPQGFQGIPGQGAQGAPSNVPGPQGYQGPRGFQGAEGFGYQGFQGYNGRNGCQGPVGAQGAQGAQGITGAQGVPGIGGAGGEGGAQGYQGATGATGATGAQGSQGVQGAAGTGSQGAQGSPGAAGFTGCISGTGWTELPNGLIMQWGQVNPTQSPQYVAWPRTFPTGVFSILVTPFADGKRSGAVASYGDNGGSWPDPTTSGAWLGAGEGRVSSWEIIPFYWMAIGN